MKRKKTIKDIARETGLSTATVSKYLNGIRIQEENRAAIEAAVERLGYRPNRSAQMLRSGRTRTIGVLISDLGNYFWGPVIGTISHYFAERQYTVVACSFNFDKQQEEQVIQDIISQNFEGIILLPFDDRDVSYHVLQEVGIPVVLLDQLPAYIGEYPVDTVLSDNYGGSVRLAELLYENGHRDIYILDRSLRSYTVDLRVKAILDVYARHGIDLHRHIGTYPPIPFMETQSVIDQGRERIRQVMNGPSPPTAVFFTNYLTAMGGLNALNSSGTRIPEDLSLVCFDYDPLFSAMQTSMTCVSQDLASMGTRAAELLMRRISGDYETFPEAVIVDVQFHQGESVRSLALKDP